MKSVGCALRVGVVYSGKEELASTCICSVTLLTDHNY